MARGALLLLLLAGCGGMAAKGSDAPTGCPPTGSTVALSVTPDPLVGGDAVDLEIRWTVSSPLTPPVVANLRVGDGPVVEVDVPLLRDGGAYEYEYAGSLLNPFGAGAPAGTLEVLTSAGSDSGCGALATAATAITLE